MADRTHYVWRWCACERAALEAHRQAVQAATAQHTRAVAACTVPAPVQQLHTYLHDLRDQQMTLSTFQRDWLRSDAHGHPYDRATAWLDAALTYGDHAVYQDPASPPAALYCYAPTRGCGKTHLAVALALHAQARGKPVLVLEESQYLRAYWRSTLEAQDDLVKYAGRTAWLTVIDDLGQRHRGSTAVQDAWFALLNARWSRGGWTLITSNLRLAAIQDREVVSESTWSRLMQMTRQQALAFIGTDARVRPGGTI